MTQPVDSDEVMVMSRGEPSSSAQPVRGAATAFTDILSVSAARGVSILLAAVTVTIITHLLSPAQYAILAYITVISGLMFTTAASWTAAAVTRYGREELERTGSVRATSWSRLILTAPLIILGTVLLVALKLADALPTALTWRFVAIAVATGVALIAAEHFLNLLEACGRMKLTAVGLVLQRGLVIAGLVVLIGWGATRSPAAIALISLGAGCVVAIGLGRAVWSVGMSPPTIDPKLFKRITSFALPLIAFSVSQYVIQAVDVVILGAYRPSRDVGVYAVAYQGYGVLLSLATTVTIVLSPLFVSLRSAARDHLIERFYERTVPQVLFLTSVATGLIAALLPKVVPLIFGKAFGSAAVPFAILLIAWIMFAATSFVAPILVLHERSRAIGAISTVAAIVNVVGDWLLVGVFGVGIVGPAAVTAASLVVIAVGYFTAAAGCIGQRRVFPVTMIVPGIAGVALALALPGVLGMAVSISGTLLAAVITFVWGRPFNAGDVDLIGRLDIPGPWKQLTLRALARLS